MTIPNFKQSYSVERTAIFASLFFLAFGIGLIADGKKLHIKQLRLSQQVDFRSTLNPYSAAILKN